MNGARRLLFLAGQIGLMANVRFFFQWVLKFAKQPAPTGGEALGVLGVPGAGTATLFSAAAVGAALLAFRVFDGVTDPIVGLLGDAWVRRGHERRSLVWFSFWLPALGLGLCFAPAHGMAPMLRWAFLVVGMFVFFVGYTCYAIPYWSLVEDYGGESVRERSVLSNLLGAGILLATAAAFVVSPVLVERFGYLQAALLFALPGALCMTAPYFAAPPGGRSRRPQALAFKSERAAFGWQSLWAALRHRRFVAVVILFAGSQMSFTVMTAAAPFIAERLLGGSDADVARLLGPFLGTAIPFFLVCPAVSRRLGWQRAVVLASVWLAGVYVLTSQLGRTIVIDRWWTAMLLFAVGGPAAALLLGLEGEAITACARERGAKDAVSVYFGVFNFLVKALNGVAIFVAGALAELADDPAWGTRPIEAMSYVAGGMLVGCAAASFWIARAGSQSASEPSAA